MTDVIADPSPAVDADMRDLAYAYGQPRTRAVVKSRPEDFRVDEELKFAPDGSGGHALLRVEKRNANTEWVGRVLARHAGVRPVDVGYAGLKDRAAVTTQWFSIDLKGKPEPDWAAPGHEDIVVLEVSRHRRKLRRGVLRGNRFTLRLREVSGDRPDLEQRLACIAKTGIPNYFGEQRFGHDNLAQAAAMFADPGRRVRHFERGLYLSAVRAWLFNQVLTQRVADGTWDHALPGDAMALDGSHSFFVIDEPDADIDARLAVGDIHPSGPLWGRGELSTREEARRLEESSLAQYEEWRRGLESAGLEQQRRPLRVIPARVQWSWGEERDNDNQGETTDWLELSFALPAGAYATSLLRELVEYGAISSGSNGAYDV